MRSSIACVRCRRSKVKCVNSGVNTTCRACENSGRDCQYPPPVASGSRKRESSISGRQDAYADSERRPRPRKSAHSSLSGTNGHGSRDSPRPLLDALDPHVLTPDVWEQLFEIFETHYSADLPFLHKTTFLEPVRRPSMPPPGGVLASAKNARPPGPEEFLLAFLALTARFHPAIVAHHSPSTASRPSNPLIASEYYATAANERLLSVDAEPQITKLESVQAALMLGLHEWGMCRGYRAWIRVGMATRAAQAMGLQYEKDLDDEPNSRSMALDVEAKRMGLANDRKPSMSFSAMASDDNPFVEQEIRRRTFWSCYVMDRYMSSGKYRPQMLHARELRIQLPASERTFLFGNKVRTMLLEEHGAGRVSDRQASLVPGIHKESTAVPSPNSINGHEDDDQETWETGVQEGLVSRYMRILEIYGRVVQWSCAGGRRIEEHPPWDHRSEYWRLLRACKDFKASLPREDTLTPQHTRAHISMKDQTPYVLLHTVYNLCQIMLHREYVPFIPLRSKKPEGPLDPPLFPADKYDVPPGFWEDSARQCFKAARDIMDLVRACDDCRVLVETPIVGFAIYTVAFVGVYCINFPWMDPDGYMCTPLAPHGGKPTAQANGPAKGFEAARKSLEMVGGMRPKLHMADGWFKTINRMHKYFRSIKRDYEKNVRAVNESMASDGEGSSVSSRQLSLREGGNGGGLEEFRLFERTLLEFGNIEEHDVEMADAHPNPKALDGLYDDDNGSTVKSEEDPQRSAPAEQPPKTDGPWNAINTTPGAPRPASAATPTTNGTFRSYESYQQPTAAYAPSQPPTPYQPPHVNNFRPAYMPRDGPPPPSGVPPGLTSPNARTASTGSHPSPSYDGRHQSYGSWTPHNTGYSMHPPQQPHHAYTNGSMPQHGPQPGTPVDMMHAYPTPGAPVNHGMPPQQHMQDHPPPQVYDPMAKEAWLNNVNQTGLSGDDVAVFVDGGEMTEWAARNPNGWLGQIYNHQY